MRSINIFALTMLAAMLTASAASAQNRIQYIAQDLVGCETMDGAEHAAAGVAVQGCRVLPKYTKITFIKGWFRKFYQVYLDGKDYYIPVNCPGTQSNICLTLDSSPGVTTDGAGNPVTAAPPRAAAPTPQPGPAAKPAKQSKMARLCAQYTCRNKFGIMCAERLALKTNNPKYCQSYDDNEFGRISVLQQLGDACFIVDAGHQGWVHCSNLQTGSPL